MSAGRIPRLFAAVTMVPLAASTMTNCSSQPPAKSMHSRNFDLLKSPAEITTLEKRVANGDGQAAWELATHYAFGLSDEAKAEPWLQKAARLGSPRAKRYIEIREERKRGGAS